MRPGRISRWLLPVLLVSCTSELWVGDDTYAICTPGDDPTCDDDPARPVTGARCAADGTCLCGAGAQINHLSGRCRLCPDATCAPPACRPGENAMCGLEPNSLTLWGICLEGGVCACLPGFVINAATRRCTVCLQDGCEPAYCAVGHDLTCNDDPLAGELAGVCRPDGTCSCAPGFAVNPASGRCRPCAGQACGLR